MRCRRIAIAIALAISLSTLASCRRPAVATTNESETAFSAVAEQVLQDYFRRNPSDATDLGIHDYDDRIEDLSQSAIQSHSAALKSFRQSVAAIGQKSLPLSDQLDREQLLRTLDAQVLMLDVVQPWRKDPDLYSSGITRAAHVVMKRPYAPAADRLRSLITRERQIPAALAEARRNLDNPPRISTEVAIEQIDGNIAFFKTDLPAAFADVGDATLLAEFKTANANVIQALEHYKTFLQLDLLPRSHGSFAWGADTYAKALAANEMIEVPLARLLSLAEQDMQRNEAAFQAAATAIDPARSADAVLASLQQQHPPAGKLLETTQTELDSLRQFIVDRHIATIPPSEPATVKETTPFRRSTTSASMDIPGPFEPAKLPSFYYMTLPDPRWKRSEQADFMRSWYYPAITNVSVHEVYPGHYLQFLYARQFPSDVRRVFGTASNAEGWAHYAEQMMLDEGFHDGDSKYRVAQLQDALLRDVRFIVGIKLHTQGLSMDEAITLFETSGHQPRPIAVSETKRGTSDALYGYYTMGKLAILKLREDYHRQLGSAYTLQKFHDAFIALGPLPIPLVRRALLGEEGDLF